MDERAALGRMALAVHATEALPYGGGEAVDQLQPALRGPTKMLCER